MNTPEERALERVAQITAHRACCGTEHDPANGKIHGYCVVCGVPWPCEYAGTPPLASLRAQSPPAEASAPEYEIPCPLDGIGHKCDDACKPNPPAVLRADADLPPLPISVDGYSRQGLHHLLTDERAARLRALSGWDEASDGWERALARIAALEAAPREEAPAEPATCATCGSPATCYGCYDLPGPSYACDECCKHGQEDGKCVSLEAPDAPANDANQQVDVRANVSRAIKQRAATRMAAENAPPDPLSPEAFRGRTTPDGKPVRWVAWDDGGVAFEESCPNAPERDEGCIVAFEFRGDSYNHAEALFDPARAGQTLWVGEGPDPRTQPAPASKERPCDVCEGTFLTADCDTVTCAGCGKPIPHAEPTRGILPCDHPFFCRSQHGLECNEPPLPEPAALPPLVELSRFVTAHERGANLWSDIAYEIHDALREERAARERDLRELANAKEALATVYADYNDCVPRLLQAERERDSYKRAKAENDERFMLERDEARAIAEDRHDRLGGAIERVALPLPPLPWKVQP